MTKSFIFPKNKTANEKILQSNGLTETLRRPTISSNVFSSSDSSLMYVVVFNFFSSNLHFILTLLIFLHILEYYHNNKVITWEHFNVYCHLFSLFFCEKIQREKINLNNYFDNDDFLYQQFNCCHDKINYYSLLWKQNKSKYIDRK